MIVDFIHTTVVGGKSILYLENSKPSGCYRIVAGSKISRLCSAFATAQGVFYIGGRGLQQGVGRLFRWQSTSHITGRSYSGFNDLMRIKLKSKTNADLEAFRQVALIKGFALMVALGEAFGLPQSSSADMFNQ
jgi:hypothetical protein